MPIYEFHCRECGTDCEVLVRSSSTTPTCPGCGSADLARKLSLFAAKTDNGAGGSGSGCASCASGSCATCHG